MVNYAKCGRKLSPNDEITWTLYDKKYCFECGSEVAKSIEVKQSE